MTRYFRYIRFCGSGLPLSAHTQRILVYSSIWISHAHGMSHFTIQSGNIEKSHSLPFVYVFSFFCLSVCLRRNDAFTLREMCFCIGGLCVCGWDIFGTFIEHWHVIGFLMRGRKENLLHLVIINAAISQMIRICAAFEMILEHWTMERKTLLPFYQLRWIVISPSFFLYQ